MLIKAEYIDRFKIIKSQMSFDFSSPIPPSAKHEEVHTVRATTRHLASGTVAQVQAHQRRTEVVDKPPADHNFYINKYKDIATKFGAATAKERARQFVASSGLGRDFGESIEQFYARKPGLGQLRKWVTDGFPDIGDKQPTHTAQSSQTEVAHQRLTEVNMQDMVHEARRWKGAAMNADEDHGTDNRARLKHSRMTTKADLDSYLMRKFGVDETTARSVSNHLTEKNIPADRSAEPSEFAGEAWADAVIAKKTVTTPSGVSPAQKRKEAAAAKDFEVFAVREANANRNFEESLQTIAGITPEQASRVNEYYHKHKLVNVDLVNGTIRPKHGAYLDKDVILNAVKETEPTSFEAPIMEVPKRKPRTKPEPKPAPEHRIAKVDDPDGGHGHFVVYDKDMKTVGIPNEHGEIEAAWPRLLDASRALNRHTGNTHTQTKVARGEYDMHKAIAHPAMLKSRKLHGSINFNGLDISIETGRSRCREWYNPHDGSQGMSRMTLPYGYIKRSLGVDGDHYDAFVGPDHSAPNVYIVTTMKAPDFIEIDEEKAFLGVNSAEEAERYFKSSYSDDRFFGGITEMPFEEFKEKVLATKNNPELLGDIRKSGEAMCKQIGDKLGVNWKETDLNEFCDGMQHEEEHKDVTGGSAEKTAKIVLAHLKEDPKYYSKLEQAGL